MKKNVTCHAGSGALYGTGVIGALIYYLQNSTSIMDAIVGIIKSFFWPAVLVYKALELLSL